MNVIYIYIYILILEIRIYDVNPLVGLLNRLLICQHLLSNMRKLSVALHWSMSNVQKPP